MCFPPPQLIIVPSLVHDGVLQGRKAQDHHDGRPGRKPLPERVGAEAAAGAEAEHRQEWECGEQQARASSGRARCAAAALSYAAPPLMQSRSALISWALGAAAGYKTPISMLTERCQKEKWDRPSVDPKKGASGQWSASVTLRRKNAKGVPETVYMRPPPPPSPIAVEKGSAMEAKCALYTRRDASFSSCDFPSQALRRAVRALPLRQ